MGFVGWLRRLLKRRRTEPTGPLSPAEEMKAALGALHEQQHRKRRRSRKGRRHVDDYRELVLDGAEKVQLSEALLHLTRESHRNRRRLLEGESPTVEVGAEQGDEQPGTVQQTADRAVKALKERMEEEDIPEPTHYYSPSERAETGEVDRTYDTGGGVEEGSSR